VRLALIPDERATAIVWSLAVVPSRLLAIPRDPAQALTLVTSVFLHAGWLHLAGNLLYLLVFGPNVEMQLGRGRYLVLYAVSGVAGALLHAFMNPTSSVPLVGASAAIAGVLGAHIVLAPKAKVTTAVPFVFYFELATLPAAFVISLWFAFQVVLAIAPEARSGAESVAWFAHLGGFTTGMLMASPTALGAGRRRRKSHAR
jgi:membrane associated rhomboid family serine protease